MGKLLCLPAGMLVLIALFSSCKKQPPDDHADEEPGIYISNYDTTTDFSTYKTFSVTDSLDLIQDNELFGKELIPFDTVVLYTISRLMQQRGYRPVGKSEHPDLVFNVSRIYSDYTGVFSYADYWNDYYDFYDPNYWGYPGYRYHSSYHVSIYTIENGALSIDLLDLKNAAANIRIKPVWSGLARGEGVFNTTNAAIETEALFNQSAYVKTTD